MKNLVKMNLIFDDKITLKEIHNVLAVYFDVEHIHSFNEFSIEIKTKDNKETKSD